MSDNHEKGREKFEQYKKKAPAYANISWEQLLPEERKKFNNM